MDTRLKLGKVNPGAYTAMDGLEEFVAHAGIPKPQQELIRIRASQINGCAFCVDQHSRDARKGGESEQRVYLVSAWREAGSIFTEEERLIFRMTEEITLIHQQGLTDAAYAEAIARFGEAKTVEIIMVIIAINAWNRIGVSTSMHPAKEN